MPGDDALNVARRQLNLRTYAAVPPLAFEGASQTDIGPRKGSPAFCVEGPQRQGI